MRRIRLRMLLLALTSAVPITLAAMPGQAAAPEDKGKADAPAEAAEASAAQEDAVPGKAQGHARSAAKRGGGVSNGDGLGGDAPDSDGGSVSANSGAQAGVSTDDGLEAQAASEASAGVTEGDSGTTISAETTADTSVSTTTGEEIDSRTVSFSKDITTRFGERSMSRSMTFSTLEDGTKVRTKSHAKAMALDTPGITKADARSRTDVRVQGDFGTEDAAVSGSDPDMTDSTLDSPAISEANSGG